MVDHPPYLFDAGPAALAVSTDVDGAIIDVAVRGDWHSPLALAVARTIRQCLAESPAAIVIDATALSDEAAASVPVWFSAAQAAAAASPPARLAICLPPESALTARLNRIGADRYLPIFASRTEARTTLGGERPLTDLLRFRLAPSPVSPSVARNLVGSACQAWNLTPLLHPGRAVLSELVANAVEHAGTEMEVSISRRGAALHLAVRDRERTFPRLRDLAPAEPGRPLDERGHGLRVVHADSLAWGAIPTDGGKMVWATVRDRAGRRRRW
jgi:anti-sigma regulatory factor (Ser/Thr protein kinase)